MSKTLTIIEDPMGRMWADGLFFMHDTKGFPLVCSLDECAKRTVLPSLTQFVYDAMIDGKWPKERAVKLVNEALSDMPRIPKDWEILIGNFRRTFAA